MPGISHALGFRVNSEAKINRNKANRAVKGFRKRRLNSSLVILEITGDLPIGGLGFGWDFPVCAGGTSVLYFMGDFSRITLSIRSMFWARAFTSQCLSNSGVL